MEQSGLRGVVVRVGGFDAFRTRAGVSRRTLFNWLNDGVPLSKLPAVARAVGSSAGELRPDVFIDDAATEPQPPAAPAPDGAGLFEAGAR